MVVVKREEKERGEGGRRREREGQAKLKEGGRWRARKGRKDEQPQGDNGKELKGLSGRKV